MFAWLWWYDAAPEALARGVRVTAVCPGAVATGLYNLSERYQRLA